jgi:ADP-ribosylglycohydrolase
MIGAIAGDIIGSVFEFSAEKPPYDFPLFEEQSSFTDDTVLSVALADSILNNIDYMIKLREYHNIYPDCGYGGMFRNWAIGRIKGPYNSWGNGSAMRVSPVGWAYSDLESVLEKSKNSAVITHNHPEGIKGAQATALSIYLARMKMTKEKIKNEIEKRFSYNLNLDLEFLREEYKFNESCQQTVPQAIYTFLISENFEDSIRKAIYIGGDSDTLACINGSIAEAYYGGVPFSIKQETFFRLDKFLIDTIKTFESKYVNFK